jgi:hypothetical protein
MKTSSTNSGGILNHSGSLPDGTVLLIFHLSTIGSVRSTYDGLEE